MTILTSLAAVIFAPVSKRVTPILEDIVGPMLVLTVVFDEEPI